MLQSTSPYSQPYERWPVAVHQIINILAIKTQVISIKYESLEVDQVCIGKWMDFRDLTSNYHIENEILKVIQRKNGKEILSKRYKALSSKQTSSKFNRMILLNVQIMDEIEQDLSTKGHELNRKMNTESQPSIFSFDLPLWNIHASNHLLSHHQLHYLKGRFSNLSSAPTIRPLFIANNFTLSREAIVKKQVLTQIPFENQIKLQWERHQYNHHHQFQSQLDQQTGNVYYQINQLTIYFIRHKNNIKIQFIQKMIENLITQYRLELKKPMRKIYKLCKTQKGYVFLASSDELGQQKLAYADENCQIKWERYYKQSLGTFGMLNDKQVIIMSALQSKVEVINLQCYKIISLDHGFSLSKGFSLKSLYTFTITQIFVIVEKVPHAKKLVITYYDYPNLENVRKILKYQTQEGEWNEFQDCNQVNLYSKIAWWDSTHSEQVKFKTLQLYKSKKKQKLKQIKVRFSQQEYLTDVQINISQMWQTKPGMFMLVCNSNVTSYYDQQHKQTITANRIFLVDVKQQILRCANFTFPYRWNSRIIDYFTLGEISVFHTVAYQNGKSILSPIFYVQNTEQFIYTIEQSKESSLTHYYIPGFKERTLIKSQYKRQNIKDIKVTITEAPRQKDLYLYLMLGINEDFDQDLLYDAIELLKIKYQYQEEQEQGVHE